MPFFSSHSTRVNQFTGLFWTAITLIFLYERTYLIQKAGLPHFIECAIIRVGLLLLLCQFHLKVLRPRFYQKKRYWLYVGLLGVSVIGYLIAQGLYDHYLFGYVIGDQYRRGLLQNLPYNLLTTAWYLLLTTLIARASAVGQPAVAPDSQTATSPTQTVLIKSGTQWIHLPINGIYYAQGLKDYTVLYTDTGRHIVKGSVGKLTGQFPPDQFVRIHKSYWVAWQHVCSVSASGITLPTQTLPLGRTYASTILSRWRQQATSVREKPVLVPAPMTAVFP
ncbi:LytTR family transcriptional regulator [Fibrella sp. HMF5335]|uniref:LytTR family transcriptional regulator n=1 Tax=Fibrella rubiginis TaxID=2817060 RepID=A0A939GI35_9BACT|nr:LytTR family DNA-binding domain-containing protein [Fibrella rubiginis]MBO0936857.1 LytTR family transcriptional regulator [Fibrella rubiginis]